MVRVKPDGTYINTYSKKKVVEDFCDKHNLSKTFFKWERKKPENLEIPSFMRKEAR